MYVQEQLSDLQITFMTYNKNGSELAFPNATSPTCAQLIARDANNTVAMSVAAAALPGYFYILYNALFVNKSANGELFANVTFDGACTTVCIIICVVNYLK